MSVAATIALFDIDGTLVLTGGAGRRAVERAFEAVCGAPDACDGLHFAGMTDPLIMEHGLERLGWAVEQRTLEDLFARYLGFLESEVAAAEAYRVLPGVRETLAAAAEAGLAVGLGTGNLEDGARIKLERAGLWQHFEFGGYGSDHAERAELLRAGAERGARALGVPLARCRVRVIGDTVRDVRAARAIGAEVLGVATGPDPVETLTAAGAHLACESLEDAQARAWLTAGPR